MNVFETDRPLLQDGLLTVGVSKAVEQCGVRVEDHGQPWVAVRPATGASFLPHWVTRWTGSVLTDMARGEDIRGWAPSCLVMHARLLEDLVKHAPPRSYGLEFSLAQWRLVHRVMGELRPSSLKKGEDRQDLQRVYEDVDALLLAHDR